MTGRPQVLFMDNHLAVAVKPAGFLSQPDGSPAPDILSWLKEDIRQRYQKPGQVFLGLVHRLDRPVSGVMVFARTSKAARRLSEQVRQRQMAKWYLAIVSGCPRPEQDTWQDQLQKESASNQVRVVDGGQGRKAWLSYRRLSWRPDLNQSLLAIRLGSGRAHQIRVQAASRGFPIIGDRRYGLQKSGSYRDKEPPAAADIALLAAGLGFYHPVSKQWLTFRAPLPPDWPWLEYEKLAEQISAAFIKDADQIRNDML